MMERLKFNLIDNHPYPDCTTFAFEHSSALTTSPAERKRYAEPINEIVVWCTERFGKPGNTARWDYSFVGVFYFDDADAAFEFRINWC